MDQTPEIDFPSLEANPDIVTVKLPQAGSGYALMFNHQKFPTSELPVRRAMQLAMDRQGYDRHRLQRLWHAGLWPADQRGLLL
jgi:ABC-type transport system substrate-binding protein